MCIYECKRMCLLLLCVDRRHARPREGMAVRCNNRFQMLRPMWSEACQWRRLSAVLSLYNRIETSA